MERNISQAVVRRMPRYYRYLGDLIDEGVERVSSKELSERMNVTASQIRQDLNNFGGFGQQGYGYNVLRLHEEIGRILGLDTRHNVIVIGAGNMGQALTKYSKFKTAGFDFIALFDIDKSLDGKNVDGVPIMMFDKLEDFLKGHRVDIATLTLPKESAAKAAEQIVKLGIKAIWNFAHIDLDLPRDVIVENAHLSDSLMRLSYATAARNS